MSAARAAALALAAALLAPLTAGAHQEAAGPLPAAWHELSAPAREAAAALARWDPAAARAALVPLASSTRPADLLLRAQLAFLEGDYEGAVRLLDAPGAAGADPAFDRLVRDTLRMRRGLAARESEHFVLWHDAQRDWVLAGPALEALEAGRRAAAACPGDEPPGKVRVEIVPSAADFEAVSSLTKEEIETSGAIGVCKFGKIMLLSPRLLLRGYPWRDALNHEYLHFLEVRLSANRAPIWLQEGVARYGESLWRAPAPSWLGDVDRGLLARAQREGGLIGFDAMDPTLVRLPTAGAVRLAFAECAFAVEYLLARWDAPGLRRLLAAFAAGGPGDAPGGGTGAALAAALGVSRAEFEEGWRAALAARGFAELPGVVVPPYRLAGEGAAEDWDLAEWQPLESQNHLRLGDLLRRRGNTRAALVEYGRAIEAAPASPYAHFKAARAQLELGKAAEAAAEAREAARLAPAYPAAAKALADALAALGDWPGAEGALRAALEVNPFDPFAWRDLGEALARQGRQEEARRPLETALRLAPDRAAVEQLMQGGR